jgi:hypothetical protein
MRDSVDLFAAILHGVLVSHNAWRLGIDFSLAPISLSHSSRNRGTVARPATREHHPGFGVGIEKRDGLIRAGNTNPKAKKREPKIQESPADALSSWDGSDKYMHTCPARSNNTIYKPIESAMQTEISQKTVVIGSDK